MAGNRIIFIPFEGGVSQDSAIEGTVKSYKDKYPDCKMVEWSYYVADRDWSDKQEESPLGKGVNVNEDVITIVGHGSFLSSVMSVKANVSKPGLVLTDHPPTFPGKEIRLTVKELAARLDWMGLRTNHKYIKLLSCCGAGLGEYDPGANKLNVDLILNDKYPHTLARNLAKELGQERTWKNKKYQAHPQIRVGGYPGYVDCVKKEKMVSWLIAKDQDDLAVNTVMEERTNWAGLNPGQFPKREAFNRLEMTDNPDIPKGRRLIMFPTKVCLLCGEAEGHKQGCSNSQFNRKNMERIVPAIWYDHLGRVLHDKRQIQNPSLRPGFKPPPVTSDKLLKGRLPNPP